MAKKNKNTNGLDIQKSYICVAQFNSRDVAVRQVAVQPLSLLAGGDAGEYWDAVAGELKEIGKKFRFGGADIICSLPCDLAVVRALEAQSDERDQEDILRWELAASVMGAIDEYAYDFYEINPGNQIECRKYIAAAMRRETMNRMKKAVKSAKLNPYIVDIDLFALTNVFQSNYRERLPEASVLVHGEFGGTKMILVRNSSYVDYAIFNFDAGDGGVTEYADTLKGELERLLQRNGIPLGGAGVFLAGALFADEEFAAMALVNVPKCEMLDPFRRVVCTAGMDENQLKTYSSRLAVSVGLALRGDIG